MDGWTREISPFHEGELEIQRRYGVEGKLDVLGRNVVREFLPDQHRTFYANLPHLFIGSVDAEGRVWGSIVADKPGFVATPDERSLTIDYAIPAVAPLSGVKVGDKLGFVGVEFATRRRNRLTATVSGREGDRLTLTVDQSFGNCPQYIQTREPERVEGFVAPTTSDVSANLTTEMTAMIEKADTFFFASVKEGDADDPRTGTDMSHRGGKPGFVKIEGNTLSYPDFAGNLHYNTLGNVLLDPRAGWLFVDFETGDTLQVTGKADIIFEGPEVEAFRGAERIVKMNIDEARLIKSAIPLRFSFDDYSPMLDKTGDWESAAQTLEATASANEWRPFKVKKIVRESTTVKSFYLAPDDGKGVATYKPGQFLPIQLDIPGHDKPVRRTYTVSQAPIDATEGYRLSIKREAEGTASIFMHDSIEEGSIIHAQAPRGDFFLLEDEYRPAVLLSGGIGMTPMISMLDHIIAEGHRSRFYRKTYFIHGTRNSDEFHFAQHLIKTGEEMENVTLRVAFDSPKETDELGKTHTDEGFITKELLQDALVLDDYDYYLCGPPGFMQAVFKLLRELGAPKERIHYEFFGPATVLDPDAGSAPAKEEPAAAPDAASEPATVTFEASGVTAEWTPGDGTLLDLAEANGIDLAFGCRAGVCGTCVTRITSGEVHYPDEPGYEPDEGEILACCSEPKGPVTLDA